MRGSTLLPVKSREEFLVLSVNLRLEPKSCRTAVSDSKWKLKAITLKSSWVFRKTEGKNEWKEKVVVLWSKVWYFLWISFTMHKEWRDLKNIGFFLFFTPFSPHLQFYLWHHSDFRKGRKGISSWQVQILPPRTNYRWCHPNLCHYPDLPESYTRSVKGQTQDYGNLLVNY